MNPKFLAEKTELICFDFDGVFTDNKVYTNAIGEELIRCDRGDGLAFEFLRHFAMANSGKPKMIVLTKERNPVLKARTAKLKLETYMAIDNKLAFLDELVNNSNGQLSWQNIVYLGNDLNDYACMRKAGFSVCPADAHPKIQEISTLVCSSKGGDGFIREFIEYAYPLVDYFTGNN